MKRLLSHRYVMLAASLALADGLFFGLTDPTRAPSTFFIVAFMLLALNLVAVLQAVCKLIAWYGVPLKHRRRLVASVTGGICALLALQSVGQLSSRDIFVLLPLGLGAYFYISLNQHRYE